MFERIPERVDFLSNQVLGAALKVHEELGPGLIESVYEICFAYELAKARFTPERQVKLPIIYDGVTLDAELRLDVWLERSLIV